MWFGFYILFLIYFSPRPSASLPAGPPPQVSPDEAEQQAVHLLACSADMLPAPLPPINMFDLLEALQVRTMCRAISSQILFWNFNLNFFCNCHYIVCPAEGTHDIAVNTHSSSHEALEMTEKYYYLFYETSMNKQLKKKKHLLFWMWRLTNTC